MPFIFFLFLKKTEYDFYSIVSVNQGKFNIDGLDQNEKKKSEDVQIQYKNLKKQALEKYKKEIEDVLGKK